MEHDSFIQSALMATNLINQEQKYIEIGRLSAGLFHDLINPLSAILLNLEEVVNNRKLKAKDRHKYCQEALKAGYCLNQFISDVSSQIEENGILEIFNLKKLISTSQTLFNYQLIKNNIRLIIDISNSIEINGIKSRLIRIINNLLSNAIRACQEKKIKQRSLITIKAYFTKLYLEIKIIDNGVGVSAELENKLFQEFSSTKSKKLGLSGFGLYSAQKMLKKDFEGKIIYEKNISGSAFIIQIPKRLVK